MSTDIFSALQQALAGECADPYETAQRIEQRLHAAGFAVLPVPRPSRAHARNIAGGRPALFLPEMTPEQAADAERAIDRMITRLGT